MKKQISNTQTMETIRLYYGALRKHPGLLALALFNPLGAVMMSIAVPYFAGKVFAGLARQNTSLNHYLVLLAIASALGMLANRIGFTSLMTLLARAMNDLHAMVFERLLRRSIGYHNNRISGKLISDAIDFVNACNTLVGALLVTSLSFASVIVTGIVIVFVSSWQLGLFLSGIVAVTLVWAAFDSRVRSSLRQKRLAATKQVTGQLSDAIVNTQTVKTFAREDYELMQSAKLNNHLRMLREHDWRRAGNSGSNRVGALMFMQFGMILFLMHLVHQHPAMLATGIFAFTYTFTLTTRLFEINNLTRQIEEAFLNASPMTKMLREDIEIQDKLGADRLDVKGGGIDLQKITFAYTDKTNSETVFKNFSLQIAPGEKVGLVGPSGGGKSTLTRLLLRFDEVQEGYITIDGQNIYDVTQNSLRSAIAYVPQEPLLFHRSIRENIKYGKPKATDDEMIAAAKKAKAHSFIAALPGGYDTVVGERGVKLSGGQRQRVAIARAILKDAPILILDEATSALDSENEQAVQKALWELMKGCTVLVIAHRLSTIQKMDRIVVLDHGTIVEQGTHRGLLAEGHMYSKLWKHQSGGFIEE